LTGLAGPDAADAVHRRHRGRRTVLISSKIILLLIFVLLPVSGIQAADGTSSGGDSRKQVGVWFPPNDFYTPYIADPLRPQNAITAQWLADSDVPDTGAALFGLRLGGVLGIYRSHPEEDSERGWQISFEGGFLGQFDMEYSLDNIGWDGFFGLYFDWMLNPNLGFRVGTQHDSSHIGDEYSRRTGRGRVEYTREEIVVGASWRFTRWWRTYGEIGYGAGLEGAGPWSVQTGIEFVSRREYWKGHASRFAALDLRTYQETDWSTRITIQAGYWIPVGNRSSVHRIAIEAGNGRSVLGQFPWDEETWIGIGWYYDF
jgi:hypothetical protein